MRRFPTIKIQKYASPCTKRFFASTKGSIKEGWEAVIGIEVHAQINSKTKLFSGIYEDVTLFIQILKNHFGHYRLFYLLQ